LKPLLRSSFFSTSESTLFPINAPPFSLFPPWLGAEPNRRADREAPPTPTRTRCIFFQNFFFSSPVPPTGPSFREDRRVMYGTFTYSLRFFLEIPETASFAGFSGIVRTPLPETSYVTFLFSELGGFLGFLPSPPALHEQVGRPLDGSDRRFIRFPPRREIMNLFYCHFFGILPSLVKLPNKYGPTGPKPNHVFFFFFFVEKTLFPLLISL